MDTTVARPESWQSSIERLRIAIEQPPTSSPQTGGTRFPTSIANAPSRCHRETSGMPPMVACSAAHSLTTTNALPSRHRLAPPMNACSRLVRAIFFNCR